MSWACVYPSWSTQSLFPPSKHQDICGWYYLLGKEFVCVCVCVCVFVCVCVCIYLSVCLLSSQDICGWYYLLGEELGRSKHLKVAARRIRRPAGKEKPSV